MSKRRDPKPGDFVTCNHAVEVYYSGYGGREKATFRPGMVGRVAAVAPKVRIIRNPPVLDGREEFLVVDFRDPATGRVNRAGLNFINAVLCEEKAGEMEIHRQLAAECVELKERLMRHGLWKTGQVMEKVVRSVGWEIAERIQKASNGKVDDAN